MDLTCHVYNITYVCLNSVTSMNYCDSFARDLCIFLFSLTTEINSLLVSKEVTGFIILIVGPGNIVLNWCSGFAPMLLQEKCIHYYIRFAYDSILNSFIQYYLSMKIKNANS